MAEYVATDADITVAPLMLLKMMTGCWVSKAVYVAAKLGIADLLSDGTVACDDLAKTTGTHAPSLYRTLRALAIMYGEEQYRAWGDLLYSVQTGRPAFERQFGMGVFEYFRQNPEASAVFNEAMTNWTTQVANAVAASYDFSRFNAIVDIGGNQGTLLAAILKTNPAARGMLFDLPHVVASAEEYLAKAGVESRCELVVGDFFTLVPTGGDVYLLAHILHDWDDERCMAILAQCRRVVPSNGNLLIIELVLPEGNEPFFGKWVDLHMLVMASGRERTAQQYRKLLNATGFELSRVMPTPVGQSVIEAAPV